MPSSRQYIGSNHELQKGTDLLQKKGL